MTERIVKCPRCGKLIRVCYDFALGEVYCIDCHTLFKLSEADALLGGINTNCPSNFENPNLCIDLDKFEDICVIRDGYKIELNKSKILMFLELFRK